MSLYDKDDPQSMEYAERARKAAKAYSALPKWTVLLFDTPVLERSHVKRALIHAADEDAALALAKKSHPSFRAITWTVTAGWEGE